MSKYIRETFENNDGIFQLIPNLIPVKFGKPGRRLKIHPADYYAFGVSNGSIKERWLCSVSGTRVKNANRPDQGLSYVRGIDGNIFLLKDAMAELKEELIGEILQKNYGIFPVYSKFFDYATPLYFHFHPLDDLASNVGAQAKPECYYFPPQLNPHKGERPSTYLGLNKGVSKDEVFDCIKNFGKFDTNITRLSRAYDLEVGTGWYVPAGLIHAPGSLLTYEPQWGTDLNCVLENVVSDEVFSESYMTDICPKDVEDKFAYIMSAIDWDVNYEPNLKEAYFRPPLELAHKQDGLLEKWICYNNEFLASKEVTLQPGASIELRDDAAYGCVIVQGFGTFGSYDAEAVNLMRVGDYTTDEYFVSKKAAESGVKISNNSQYEPMVILQHFGPDNKVYL